ncbi:hypothetical protein SAMN02745857_02338 [Andreprevotia lacus DSM 23236]|jgi:hypothetical protein|uniref:Uncharacterized protein n=1 Tax=Andreprevotia lacus DSM 23236 TaxID=1121001 RepID=A0A1W1XPM4_9NEIS|nr:hypothetical protein [Andreprevotia lacus]SMC25909.1 hypothetical protein SAMN02745857_02338 [Andreprevotia lacus DSM 23236]
MFDFKGLVGALFGKRDQEGVYDLKSATVMMQELPESDILQAQIEIVKALKQLNTNPKISLKDRMKTVPYLDEKARTLQQHLVDIYLGRVIVEHVGPPHVLPTLLAFWAEMGDAYRITLKQAQQASNRPLDKSMHTFILRGLAYFGQQAKWAYLRYLELDPKVWRNLNRLYLLAEQQGCAATPMQGYADGEITEIRREYLQVLMLALANPERLQSTQIEVLSQWLKRWAGRIDLESQIRPNRQLFAINIAGSTPPKRLRRDMVGENWRYWTTEPLVQHMRETLEQLLHDSPDPIAHGLPAESAAPANIDLLQGLVELWSRDTPAPIRKHERRTAKKVINVIRGLDDVIQFLRGERTVDGRGPAGGRWEIENESAGGVGVTYQAAGEDKLQAGEVLGLSGIGNQPFSVGIVRRISKSLDGIVHVGIEVLTQTAVVVEMTPLLSDRSFSGVYSPDATANPRGRFLLLPQAFFADSREFRLSAQGKSYRIRLNAALEHTADATLTRFAVLEKLG